jgi:hypothetical protein
MLSATGFREGAMPLAHPLFATRQVPVYRQDGQQRAAEGLWRGSRAFSRASMQLSAVTTRTRAALEFLNDCSELKFGMMGFMSAAPDDSQGDSIASTAVKNSKALASAEELKSNNNYNTYYYFN